MDDEEIRATAARSAIQLVNGMYHDVVSAETYQLRVAEAIHAIILFIKTANFYGYLVGFTTDVTPPNTPPITLAPIPSVDPSQITATSSG